MRRVLFLPAGPSKSSMSHFSHILMFANPFPFCFKTILRFLALSVPLIATQLTAALVVSNLTASQRAGTKFVDISYDLTGTGFQTVSLEISSDGGVTWTVAVTSVSGAIGSSVAPGTEEVVVWDAGPTGRAVTARRCDFGWWRMMALRHLLLPIPRSQKAISNIAKINTSPIQAANQQ
jgi:hypothetical protein